MSKNAMRFAGGLGFVASTGVDYALSKAVATMFMAQEHEDNIAAKVAELDTEWTAHYRRGCGVAWVTEQVERKGGRLAVKGSEHRIPMPPVIYERKNNTRQAGAGQGRCVVVQVNSKLSILHLL